MPDLVRLIEEAEDTLDRGDQVRALALADQLLSMAPEHPAVRKVRARILVAADAGEEALDEARRAAELNPADPDVQVLLSTAARRGGRYTLAQSALERAIKLSGGDPGLLDEYAWFMACDRGPRLAEDAALEALALNDRSSMAWAALGLAQFRLRRRADAEISLKRALELDPNDPHAQEAMARLLQDRREDTKALALSRLLEDAPGTDQVVDGIRDEARQRKLAGLLVERGLDPHGLARQRRTRRWTWLLAALAAAVVLVAALRPATSLGVFWCVFTPLVLYWCWRLFAE